MPAFEYSEWDGTQRFQPLSAEADKEELQNALAALPLVYRAIVLMVGDGYKHREVAEKMKIRAP